MRSLALTLLLSQILANPVFAADGVLEINQTCAVQTGCFAGDAAGFPVTISGSAPARSFRLTSDLGPLPADKTAIDATQVEATIDLGGFRIFGVSVCTGVPVTSCAPTATGVGVDAGPNSVVTNGTISGMGAAVHLSYSGRLSQMNAFSNGDGFVLGNESIAEGILATSNGAAGISCAQNCVLRANTSTGNLGSGIRAGDGSIVRESTARINGQFGIEVSRGSIVSGNTAIDNQVNGINAVNGTLVENNTATANGATGIVLLSSGYRGNVVTGNGTAQVTAIFSTNLGENFCSGNGTISTTCP